MDYRKFLRRVLLWTLAALFLIGCSAAANDQLVVTFNENTCTYKGTSELSIGEHQFIVKNLINGNLSVLVPRIAEGHTYQEFEERVEEEGHKFPIKGTNWPDWMRGDTSNFVTFEKDQATGDEFTTVEISKEGDYALAILNLSDETLWLCAPLKVITAASE